MSPIKKILVVAAHPDDELLGAGATLLKLKESCEIHLIFMADGFTSRGTDGKDRNIGADGVAKALGARSLHFLDFEDNKMDKVPLLAIVQKLEPILSTIRPDTIFTHWFGDLNVDHQIAHRVVMTAARPRPDFYVNNIFSFEVPSSTGWQSPSMIRPFNPNFHVDVSNVIDAKLLLLKEYYADELCDYPHVRSLESIKNIAAYRGNQVGMKFAEGFIIERMLSYF